MDFRDDEGYVDKKIVDGIHFYQLKCRKCKALYWTDHFVIESFRRCPKHKHCSVKQSNLTGAGYLKTRFQVFQRDDFRCAYCGRGSEQGAILNVVGKLVVNYERIICGIFLSILI